MDTLIREAEEAEEVLKESDSVGSPELFEAHIRMEALKVQKSLLSFSFDSTFMRRRLFVTWMILKIHNNVFPGSPAEAEQFVSGAGAG